MAGRMISPNPPAPPVGAPSPSEPVVSAPKAGGPKVKLVIWDLDETLWKGILGEADTAADVEAFPGRLELLVRLADHGIVNAISSKNDFETAKKRLERFGVWDLFVFPAINWNPKGAQIKALIDNAGLRYENVLFVDDNHLNREEARFFCPSLQVQDPAEPGFHARLQAIADGEREDLARTRLAQYRVIETKLGEARRFESNEAFLRSCDIRVALSARPVDDLERIADLVLRTNQLNYTKRRENEATLRALVADPEVRSWSVRAWDNFGEYGVIGFVALAGTEVRHFVFSCRTLNMGIEAFLFHQLGLPAFPTVGEVTYPIDARRPDWIRVIEPGQASQVQAAAIGGVAPRAGLRRNVLFIGGCDLASVMPFLSTSGRLDGHFNYMSRVCPDLQVHAESIDFFLSDRLTLAQKDFILRTVPFVDAHVFDVPDYSWYDCIVYSPLIDYIHAKYVNDAVPGWYLSWGDELLPAMDEERVTMLHGLWGIPKDRIRQFARDWRIAAKPDEVWRAQLQELFRRFKAHSAQVIVLVGATSTHSTFDEARLPRHRHNAVILREESARMGVEVIETDPFITSRDDFTDAIRHYKRHVYFQIGQAISARISGTHCQDPGFKPVDKARTIVERLGRKTRRLLRTR